MYIKLPPKNIDSLLLYLLSLHGHGDGGLGVLSLHGHGDGGLGVLSLHGHGDGGLGVCSILCTPHGCDGLDLGVELDALLTVEVLVTTETAAGTSEGEHRQGHGDGYVHSNLPDIDLLRVSSGGGAVVGEDGGAVTVGVGVDGVDGLVQGIDLHAAQHRAKDLLPVALHVLVDLVQNGRADEVTLLIAWNLDTP